MLTTSGPTPATIRHIASRKWDGSPDRGTVEGTTPGLRPLTNQETAMRSLRTLTVAAGLLGMTPLMAIGQTKPTPEDLLRFKPSLKGVEYEVVTEPAAIGACKVEAVTDGNKLQIGFALRDGQGKLL